MICLETKFTPSRLLCVQGCLEWYNNINTGNGVHFHYTLWRSPYNRIFHLAYTSFSLRLSTHIITVTNSAILLIQIHLIFGFARGQISKIRISWCRSYAGSSSLERRFQLNFVNKPFDGSWAVGVVVLASNLSISSNALLSTSLRSRKLIWSRFSLADTHLVSIKSWS